MSVLREGALIRLVGELTLEDAEPLAAMLVASRGASVDWSGSRRMHAAVVQVLLAFAPAMVGEPGDDFAQAWLAPLLGPPLDREG